MNFISELKRRKVFRVAAAYLVVGWLLIQVAATVGPQLNLPEWAPRLITFVILLGFPIALVMAWIFDVTPDGVKLDASVSGSKRVFAVAAVLVALALGWYFHGRSEVRKPVAASTVAAAATVGVIADPHSIAVLPFVNMSGDKDNEYFSDGISEEILNVLASTPELQVAARTSSFSFKGKSLEVPDIAKALKVRMVLEGSVRKQGQRVRITAQLIDASNGFHLWSETFDRELKDIFAIQDEIARAIGEQLKVKITGLAKPGEPGRGTENRGTKNLEAYDLYLRGMALWQIRREKELWMSIEMFEKAVAIDPAFAEAYAGQALAYAVIGDYSNRLPIAETIARARDFAERALALNPALTEPYAALANVAMSENRWPTADALLSRAIALRPSFATAYQWRGNLLRSTGALDEGLLSLERASELNPRSGVVAENHAFTLRTLGRDADAIARCKELLAFDPNAEGCLGDVALAELAMGNFSAARAALEKQAAIINPSARAQGQELIDALSDRGDKHALALRYDVFPFNSKYDLASQNVFDTYDIPTVLMLLGEPELALANIERRANQLGGNAEWVIMLPQMDPIRCEPRFIAVVKKLKTHDPHFAKVCGGKK